jgi:hypothetical protein
VPASAVPVLAIALHGYVAHRGSDPEQRQARNNNGSSSPLFPSPRSGRGRTRLRRKVVSVVEVSSGSDISSLISKTKDRENQWFTRLRNQLVANSAVNDAWKLQTEAFVRGDVFDKFSTAFSGSDDVFVHKLEDIAFRWKWTSSVTKDEASERPGRAPPKCFLAVEIRRR